MTQKKPVRTLELHVDIGGFECGDVGPNPAPIPEPR